MKLIIPEAESESLWQRFAEQDFFFSSVLTEVEVLRAVGRAGLAHEAEQRARFVLDGLEMLIASTEIRREASTLQPWTVRALDAIHLATALSLGPRIDRLVTYDRRMATAADGVGLSVMAPT